MYNSYNGFLNWLNYYNPDYHVKRKEAGKKKNDDYDIESHPMIGSNHYITVLQKTNRISQFDDEFFVQLTLYSYLSHHNRLSQVDLGTINEFSRFEIESKLCCYLFTAYEDGNMTNLYESFGAEDKDEKEAVRSLINSKTSLLYVVNQKISQLNKKPTTKVHFGNSAMIFILCFLSLFCVVSSDSCCSFSPNQCPYSTNPVNYEMVGYNGQLCENYVTRYVENNSSNIVITECESTTYDPALCVSNCQSGCDGNDLFCSTRNCDGNKCACNSFRISYVYFCLNDIGEEIGEAHVATYTCYTKPITDFKKRVLISCPQIDVLADKDYFYTTINTDYTGCVLYITKDTWSYQSAYIDPNHIVKIDDSAKTRSGRFDTRITCSGNPCYHSSLSMDYSSNCIIVDCIFCWEVYSSLNCLPFSYKVFAAFCMLLTFSLMIAILPCFWILILTIWKLLMFPKYLCWPCFKDKLKYLEDKINKEKERLEIDSEFSNSKDKNRWADKFNYSEADLKSKVKRQSKDVLKEIKDDIDEDLDDITSYIGSSNPSRDQRNNNGRNNSNPGRGSNALGKHNMYVLTVTLMLFMMFRSCESITCASNPPISVSNPSCVSTSASSESCTFTFATTITIPYPGASACLMFNDNNNKLLGGLNITYVNRTDIASLTTSYYTGRWEPLSGSFHGCYLNGWCDDTCATASSRTMFGFSTLIGSWPGFTYCRRSCGCAACGCFFCDAGCVVSGYSLKYKDSAVAVAEINKLSYAYYFKYDYASTSSIWNQNTATNTIGPFKVDYVGAFAGDSSVIFGTKNVIFNSTSSYWGEAATLNSPIQQNVGDIQAASLSSLQTASTTSYIYDHNIITSVEQDKSTSFYFSNPGMNNIMQYPKFPTMIGGQVWSYSAGQIKSVASNPGSVVLTITTLSPITLTRIKTTVCPTGSFLSGSGCYSCDIGSTIIIKAKSTCSSGLVRLSADDLHVTLNTLTINLLTTESNFEIDLYTSQSINNFNLILSSDGNSFQIPISFAAIENINVRNDSYTMQNNGLASSSGWNFSFPGWDSFMSSLSDSSSPYHYSSIIILSIVIVSLFVGIIFLSFLIKSMCR